MIFRHIHINLINVRLINLCTSDKKSSHKIRHNETPGVHFPDKIPKQVYLKTQKMKSVYEKQPIENTAFPARFFIDFYK